jgi:hypothetical protein
MASNSDDVSPVRRAPAQHHELPIKMPVKNTSTPPTTI